MFAYDAFLGLAWTGGSSAHVPEAGAHTALPPSTYGAHSLPQAYAHAYQLPNAPGRWILATPSVFGLDFYNDPNNPVTFNSAAVSGGTGIPALTVVGQVTSSETAMLAQKWGAANNSTKGPPQWGSRPLNFPDRSAEASQRNTRSKRIRI